MVEKLIQTLQDVGAIAPADTHPTWHGRAAAPEDTAWYIDPSFHNGGKQKGRRNHCVRPALYTGSKECALTIARQRVKQARHHTDEILIPTAHEITPDDNTSVYASAARSDWYVPRRSYSTWTSLLCQFHRFIPHPSRRASDFLTGFRGVIAPRVALGDFAQIFVSVKFIVNFSPQQRLNNVFKTE